MTIEATLERIAEALEKLAWVHAGAAPGPAQDAPVVPAGTKEETKAAVTETTKKRPGRPAKITAEEKAAATEAEVVTKKPAPPVDDFLDTPSKEPKLSTVEDVRASLLAYAQKNNAKGEGTALARALMAKHGGAAVRLTPDQKTPQDKTGVLDEKFFDAVIKAASA